MYSVINARCDDILDNDTTERILARYVQLRDRFRQTNVAEDAAFQTKYIGYWTMGRKAPSFYACYFRLLERVKHGPLPTIEEVVRTLHDIDHSVQFSFATKLLHMCEPHLPVYDSLVMDFFFLPDRKGHVDVRLPLLLQDYGFLIDEYQRILRGKLLDEAISRLRTRYEYSQQLTEERMIDALIWAFVTWARKHPGSLKYN